MEEGLIGRYASLLNCRSMGLPFTYLGIPIGANPSKEDMWKLISIDNYLLEMWKLISIDNYLLEEGCVSLSLSCLHYPCFSYPF